MTTFTKNGIKISDNGGNKEHEQRDIASVLMTRGITFIFDREGDNYNLIVFAEKCKVVDIVAEANDFQDFSHEVIDDMLDTIKDYGKEVIITQEVGYMTIAEERPMVIGENAVEP